MLFIVSSYNNSFLITHYHNSWERKYTVEHTPTEGGEYLPHQAQSRNWWAQYD